MCKVTASMIVADGAAVGQALNNLSVALQASDPTLAANLASAATAIIAATANWQSGSTLNAVIDAENAAIAVLNVIPVASPYAPLVAIAFAALNILITNAQTQDSQTGNVVTDAHALLTAAAATASPWQGKAQIKHHFMRSPRKDFEAGWNEKAVPLGVGEVTV